MWVRKNMRIYYPAACFQVQPVPSLSLACPQVIWSRSLRTACKQPDFPHRIRGHARWYSTGREVEISDEITHEFQVKYQKRFTRTYRFPDEERKGKERKGKERKRRKRRKGKEKKEKKERLLIEIY